MGLNGVTFFIPQHDQMLFVPLHLLVLVKPFVSIKVQVKSMLLSTLWPLLLLLFESIENDLFGCSLYAHVLITQ